MATPKAPTAHDLRWLSLLLEVMFRGGIEGSSVKYEVRAAGFGKSSEARNHPSHGGWWVDGCVPIKILVAGWSKQFRVPISLLQNEDVREVVLSIARQSDGQILMAEQSIQMIESEGLVH